MNKPIRLVTILIVTFLLILNVNAEEDYSYYLYNLKEFVRDLICILIWITAPIVALMIIAGAYLLIAGTSPERRNAGKELIKSAIIGALMVAALVGVSVLLADLEICRCFGTC